MIDAQEGFTLRAVNSTKTNDTPLILITIITN